MPATTTGTPFSLNVPSASTDAADLYGLYLKPNMIALNTYAAHKSTAQTFSALQTFSAGLTVSAGTLTAAAGLTVSASGATITGNSTITGTLGGLTGLTVASGGASITGNSTITGTLGGLTGLTVASGNLTVSSGNVGIGTSSPARVVEVQSGTTYAAVRTTATNASYSAFFETTVSGGASGQLTSQGSGAAAYGIINPSDVLLMASGAVGNLCVGTDITRTTTTGHIKFFAGGANNECMRIDGNGNVGIGTTSPGSALDVKGVLRLSGSSSGYVGLQGAAAAGSATYTWPAADGAAGTVLSTNGSGTLSWASASGGGGGGARAFALMGA